MRSRSFLYLTCNSLTLGASTDMARCVLICLTKIGNNRIRTSTVRKNSDRPHVTPLLPLNRGFKTAWMPRMTSVTSTYKGFRMCTGVLLYSGRSKPTMLQGAPDLSRRDSTGGSAQCDAPTATDLGQHRAPATHRPRTRYKSV